MRLLTRWLKALSRREPARPFLLDTLPTETTRQGRVTGKLRRTYDDKMLRPERDYQDKEAS